MEESNWYIRYITNDHEARDKNHPVGREFSSLFGVPYTVFEYLIELTLEHNWYDPTAADALGNLCSDIRLLILGVLKRVTQDSSFVDNQSNTNISGNVHRVFFHMFIDLIAEMKTEWIKMPETPEELEKVTQDFEKWHFHGCCGSMDVVHIGWDCCPVELRIVFENGKEKHPTVAFQVIGSH